MSLQCRSLSAIVTTLFKCQSTLDSLVNAGFKLPHKQICNPDFNLEFSHRVNAKKETY